MQENPFPPDGARQGAHDLLPVLPLLAGQHHDIFGDGNIAHQPASIDAPVIAGLIGFGHYHHKVQVAVDIRVTPGMRAEQIDGVGMQCLFQAPGNQA